MNLPDLTGAVDTLEAQIAAHTTLPLTEDTIDALADLRDVLTAELKRLEQYKERVTQHAMACLGATGAVRREGPAFVVQIIYPNPRETVDPVKLGVLGVDAEIIRQATVKSEAKPFVRFDKRKGA